MRPKKVSYLATALCGTIGNQSPSHRECHGPWRRGPYLWQARLAHPRSLCLVGVALGDIGLHLVWQAWHLWHWAWWHRLTPTSFTQTAFRHLHRSRTYFFQYINSQTFSHATFSHRTLSPDLSSTISFLFLAFPIPSSPFFCYLLEEV